MASLPSSPLKTPPFGRLLSLPGRETAVGRALFALYNGYGAARQRGNEFSQMNRCRMRPLRPRRGSCRPSSEPVTSKQPHQKSLVKVPRFRRRPHSQERKQSPLAQGKRKASQILKQLKEDLAKMELPPYPTKPLLDDKEKQRLALLFEWGGRVENKEEFLEQLESIPRKVDGRRIAKDSTQEPEILMDEIVREIEERESFLKHMEEYGCADKYRNQIRIEVEQRVQQMKKLDEIINQQMKEKLECYKAAERYTATQKIS